MLCPAGNGVYQGEEHFQGVFSLGGRLLQKKVSVTLCSPQDSSTADTS